MGATRIFMKSEGGTIVEHTLILHGATFSAWHRFATAPNYRFFYLLAILEAGATTNLPEKVTPL